MLDYEEFTDHPFLSILVEAIDEHNFSITKQFVIEITDEEFEPDFDTFESLQVEENRMIGTLVGQFHMFNIEPHESFSYSVIPFDEDPMQIEDRILEIEALAEDVTKSQEDMDAYQVEIMELQQKLELVRSNGLFFIDLNGSLRTSQMLDYEEFIDHPFLSILVEAIDEHNFSITKQFVVEITDRVFEPVNPLPAIVRTMNPIDIDENGTGYLLQAKILADGGSYISEAGFLISTNIRFIDPIRISALIDPETRKFSAYFLDFKPGTRYYLRGYAFNDFGESKGSIKKLKTPEIVDPSAWWKNTTNVGNGWRNSDWFGAFLIHPPLDWIFHSKLGWVYTVSDGSEGIWLWHSQHGWLWTQKGVWPFLYSNNSTNWIYFMKNINGQAIFYDYETKRYLFELDIVPNF
jgi:hypothetical protein